MLEAAAAKVGDAIFALSEKFDRRDRAFRLHMWKRCGSLRVDGPEGEARLAARRWSSDSDVIWQCFVDRQYAIPAVPRVAARHREAIGRRYREILAAGGKPLIVDCGANIGASACWLDLAYPGSTIVAIEPSPDNCRLLRANVAALGNAHVIEAGIGARDGRAFLFDGGGGQWGYQVSDQPSETAVEVLSIGTVLARWPEPEYVPFILKVDIEGAERELFAGDWEAFDRFPLIMVEAHDFVTASPSPSVPFFEFHAARKRGFLFHLENIFSFKAAILDEACGAASA